MVASYGAAVLALAVAYSQPWPYFFVRIFPTMFVAHAMYFDAVYAEMSRWMQIGLLVFGVLYPAHRLLVVLGRSKNYQRFNFDLAGAILRPHDVYLAGTDIIDVHEQVLPQLSRLGGPVLRALQQQRRLRRSSPRSNGVLQESSLAITVSTTCRLLSSI